MPAQLLYLVPPLIQEGRLAQYLAHGQSISHSLSPRSNSLAVFSSPKENVSKTDASSSAGPQDIYTAMCNRAPTNERRMFVTDTSVIFAALRRLITSTRDMNDIRSRDYLIAFRKLAGDFITHAKDSWVYASQLSLSSDGPPHYPGSHYKKLYTAFSLFQSVYLPEDGEEDVPVGDELLDWLNTHFIDPSNEEADQLGSNERPWENEIFWSYVTRATIRGLVKLSIFFLRTLEYHPSENLQRIGKRLVDLLDKHPRQKHFGTEHEFFTHSRRWRDRVRSLRIDLDRVPEDDRNDGFENWWDNVSDLVGVMEGREDVLERVCASLGGTWKDIVCAHGVWIDISLRRSELPDVVEQAIANAPPDPTDREDMLHTNLLLRKGARALAIADDMDVWLSAHLAEFMLPLGILSQGTDEPADAEDIRDQYIINYADYLHSDPGLWRLTVDYLCTCGDVGQEMADEVLLRIPLKEEDLLISGKGAEATRDVPMEVEAIKQEESGDLPGIVQELNATCREYQREHTRRTICRVASQKLLRLEQYGLAVSYAKSAEDWEGIGNIVNVVLENYITNGPSRFVTLVSDVAFLLRQLKKDAEPHAVFVQRLEFAIRYAEFHQHNLQGDMENAASALMSIFEENLSPNSWLAVLLYDAIPLLQDESSSFIPYKTACLLLRRLEEVVLRASQGSGDEYLNLFTRVTKIGGQKEALRRFDILRLALARYLARSVLPTSHLSNSRLPNEM